ncbi:MAG: SIMPL domain-containing protein [bacterium]
MEEQQHSICGAGGCHGHHLIHLAKHAILGILVLALIIYVSALTKNAIRQYDYIGKTLDAKDLVTVTGEGKVTATPDVAVLSIGVISEAPTVAQATKDNTDKMNKIIEAIKNQFQVEDKDLKTEAYSVSPRYNWTNNQQKIIGYGVNQDLQVKMRNFDKVGDLLGQSTILGANSVSGPQFIIDDPEKAKAEARAKAIAQAKEKAKVLSEQVGIGLGRIVNFSEDGGNYVMPMYRSMAVADSAGSAMIKSSPDIQVGSQDITVDVSISYQIR